MQVITECFQLLSKRSENVCSFLEGGRFVRAKHSPIPAVEQLCITVHEPLSASLPLRTRRQRIV